MSDASKTGGFPISELVKAVPGFVGIRLEEEPYFELLKEEGDISFRRYEPILLARVTLRGSREKVVDEAFSKLSSFIFGENSSGAQYEMTTPVYQIPASQQAFPEALDDEQWTVAFAMSKDTGFDDLPHPKDSSISFHQWPSRTMAVYRYSGNNNDAAVLEAIQNLKAGISNGSYQVSSGLIIAQYDQPFAIPLFKRNEVQIEVQMEAEAPEHSYA
jgi:hypothetical protein